VCVCPCVRVCVCVRIIIIITLSRTRCFYLQAFFALGIMLTIPAHYIASDYRGAIATPTSISLVALPILFLYLRESPRYLLVRAQHASAPHIQLRIFYYQPELRIFSSAYSTTSLS
jgi:hypothetical protein